MLTHPHLTVRIDRSTESWSLAAEPSPSCLIHFSSDFAAKQRRVCTTDNLLVLMRCIHMSWGEACSAVSTELLCG